jgi:hypothetical protein
MYKPAYTHLMNPAWMSTFLFLAPAQRMQNVQVLACAKEIIIKLLGDLQIDLVKCFNKSWNYVVR